MTERMDTCASCRFFKADTTSVWPEGQCRRHNPAAHASHVEPAPYRGMSGITQIVAAWPRTTPDDWCGDYENRRPA